MANNDPVVALLQRIGILDTSGGSIGSLARTADVGFTTPPDDVPRHIAAELDRFTQFSPQPQGLAHPRVFPYPDDLRAAALGSWLVTSVPSGVSAPGSLLLLIAGLLGALGMRKRR